MIYRRIRELLYAWRVTAQVLRDPDLGAELTADADDPLHDVDLAPEDDA